jgi:hypothetical protein
MHFYRAHVLCCAGTGCTSSKSLDIISNFEKYIKENQLENEVKVIKTGCFGLCAEGPIVVVYPEGTMYVRVSPADVKNRNQCTFRILILLDYLLQLFFFCIRASATTFTHMLPPKILAC